MTMQLAGGISESTMRTAVRQFAAIVGADNAFFEDLDREAYADKFSIDPRLHRPAGAIAP